MKTRLWARRSIAIGVPLLFLALGVGTSLPAIAASGSDGTRLYGELTAAAAAGNQTAARALADVDAFTRRTGAKVSSAARVVRFDNLMARTVGVRGFPPFYLNVAIEDVIDSPAALDAYRAARLGELASSARARPDERLTVKVTPAGHRSVEEVWSALSRAGLTPISVMIDVFESTAAGPVWKSRFTHLSENDALDAFLDGSGGNVVSAVRGMLADAHAGESDYNVSQLTFEVFVVRATGRAADVLAFSADPAVLLVDSETAVAASYRDVAAHVRVMLPTVNDSVRWGTEP